MKTFHKQHLSLFLIVLLIAATVLLLPACSSDSQDSENYDCTGSISGAAADIPEFRGDPYIIINDNVPGFTDTDLTTTSFETYSDLDRLGRCGTAYANIGVDLMPTEKRESISKVKPSGWQTVKYDSVDGKYLYNRCHLIGYQLTAENANQKNLITGTRYMNVNGMLPFENMVADYIKETEQHVLYRVTPIYDGDDLVARGVQMEAISVEDQGESILFNVFVYNNQPGITIDYSNGDSWQDDSGQGDSPLGQNHDQTYILNTRSNKFHEPACSSVNNIKDSNKETYTGSRDQLITQGYSPCGSCEP